MALFDLLGRSWAMGIVWQLADQGPANFRQLQARCDGVSPTVLNTRLKELRAAGLVEQGPQGYQVTRSGQQLFGHLQPLARWSDKWARDLQS